MGRRGIGQIIGANRHGTETSLLSVSAGHWLSGSSRILLTCLGLLILTEKSAYAYTDPGSGALIWQLLVAGAFSVMFYFRRFLIWIRNGKSKKLDEKADRDDLA